TLTLASLILLAGSLSDRWGRRRVFLAGLGWFTLASVLCAAAPGTGWLIAARASRPQCCASRLTAPCCPPRSAPTSRAARRRRNRGTRFLRRGRARLPGRGKRIKQ